MTIQENKLNIHQNNKQKKRKKKKKNNKTNKTTQPTTSQTTQKKPKTIKGVKYREVPAGKLLLRNLLIYGLGGLVAPFIFVKLIDVLLVFTGLV